MVYLYIFIDLVFWILDLLFPWITNLDTDLQLELCRLFFIIILLLNLELSFIYWICPEIVVTINYYCLPWYCRIIAMDSPTMDPFQPCDPEIDFNKKRMSFSEDESIISDVLLKSVCAATAFDDSNILNSTMEDQFRLNTPLGTRAEIPRDYRSTERSLSPVFLPHPQLPSVIYPSNRASNDVDDADTTQGSPAANNEVVVTTETVVRAPVYDVTGEIVLGGKEPRHLSRHQAEKGPNWTRGRRRAHDVPIISKTPNVVPIPDKII